MQDTDFDAVSESTWASAARQSDVPTVIVPEFSDDIFRATQRIPRIADAPAPAHARHLTDPPVRHLAPEGSGPDRRTMVLVLLVAVASLATLIAWPLLDRRPSVPAAVPPLSSATLSVMTPAATPLPTRSTTTGTTRPLPPPPAPVPVPVETVTAVVTVLVTAPPPSTTPTPSPSPTVTPTDSGSPSASPTPSPTSGPAPFPVSTWSYTTAGLGPVLLGTTTASALAAGYLVVDAAAPSGYATAPALGTGIQLTVVGGMISAIRITDSGVRSAEGVGVGTPVTTLSTAYGTALVTLVAKDAVGNPVSVPGLMGPTSYVAFGSTNGVVSTIVVGNTQPDGTIVLP
jgi:hypothetical protein